MAAELTYIPRKDSITVFIPGQQPKTVLRTNRNFDAVVQALHEKASADVILNLVDPTQSIKDWGHGSLDVIGGVIHIDGEPLPHTLSKKVLELWDDGYPIDPYIAFHQRLLDQQSYRIAEVLFGYLDKHSFPLYEDGTFMAYKGLDNNPYKGREDMSDEAVAQVYARSPQNPHTYINGLPLSDTAYYRELLLSADYVDVHSKSVPQSVGDTVSMDRRYVNDDPRVGCSTGLHVGSHSYTSTYHVRLLVRVDPADCVSVPEDCGRSKVRVCKYVLEAIDQVKEEYSKPLYELACDKDLGDAIDQCVDYDYDEDDKDYDEDE